MDKPIDKWRLRRIALSWVIIAPLIGGFLAFFIMAFAISRIQQLNGAIVLSAIGYGYVFGIIPAISVAWYTARSIRKSLPFSRAKACGIAIIAALINALPLFALLIGFNSQKLLPSVMGVIFIAAITFSIVAWLGKKQLRGAGFALIEPTKAGG